MKIRVAVLIILTVWCQVALGQSAGYPAWSGTQDYTDLLQKAQKWSDDWGRSSHGYPLAQSASEWLPMVQTMLSGLQIDSQTTTWDLASAPGRMGLPRVIIQSDYWKPVSLGIYFPDASEEMNGKYQLYHWFWRIIMRALTKDAFASMTTDAQRAEVRTSDLLRLSAAFGYEIENDPDSGGLKPKNPVEPPLKADWYALYNSSNPCYRLIAFEFYDRPGLTPEELLSVYESGLFHSCSYVEMRILVGIRDHQDYRDEVKQLLLRYLASNPLLNDGTQISHRADPDRLFKDVREGAQKIIDEINAK